MKTIGAYEAKTNLSKLLERVIKGEKITISKHGVPVAVLQPPDFSKKADPERVIAKLRKFRDKHTLNGISIRDMINEGRR